MSINKPPAETAQRFPWLELASSIALLVMVAVFFRQGWPPGLLCDAFVFVAVAVGAIGL